MTTVEHDNNSAVMDEFKMDKIKKLNKLTIKAKLNFNVNNFKNWIKQKLRDDGKMFQNDGEQYAPKLSGAHVALSALNEKLCYIIIEKVIERLTKDKTGLYTIKYNDISDMIKVDSELRRNLYTYLDVYDNTLNYKDQYCIDEKSVKNYIDRVFSASIDISNDGFNLLIYLLLKTCVRIIDTACIIMAAAKRRTIGFAIINHCVSVHFSGTMAHLIHMKIDETIKLCGKEITDKENNGERKRQIDNDDEQKEDNANKDDGQEKSKEQYNNDEQKKDVVDEEQDINDKQNKDEQKKDKNSRKNTKQSETKSEMSEKKSKKDITKKVSNKKK